MDDPAVARTAYMIDDVIDKATERQNLPCWNTVPGVGLRAVNDIALLINGGYSLITKYFSSKSCFPNLIKLVSETFLTTGIGEHNLFILSREINSTNVYTEEDFMQAKILLNSRLLPTMPVVAAMLYNEINDSELTQTAVKIGDEIATYYTKIDDWIDVYGENAGNERTSRDIQNGSPSWLFHAAYAHGNDDQRNSLMTNYGKEDQASVEEVRKIYADLNVSKIVYEMGETNFCELQLQISQLPCDTYPSVVWINLLNHYKKTLHGQAARC